MKRYQKWLATLGLIALTPAVLSPDCQAASRRASRQAPQTPQAPVDDRVESWQRPPERLSKTNQTVRDTNQKMAEAIAGELQNANLGDENFSVEFEAGTAKLVGPVTSRQNKQLAEKVARKVRGVKRVENGLVVSPAGRTNQVVPAQSTQPAAGPKRGNVQQTSAVIPAPGEPVQAPPGDGSEPFQPTAGGAIPGAMPVSAGGQYPGGLPVMPAGQPTPGMPIQQMPAGYPSMTPPPYVPTSVPAPPGHASGGSYPGGYPIAPVYDQPNLPNHAWPTYASYPNMAQVSYPKQYSASAYPYIGPFHPYPQVPLGWRKVQLEWDDGYWQLNFRPRTEKWWWFMNPQNWD